MLPYPERCFESRRLRLSRRQSMTSGSENSLDFSGRYLRHYPSAITSFLRPIGSNYRTALTEPVGDCNASMTVSHKARLLKYCRKTWWRLGRPRRNANGQRAWSKILRRAHSRRTGFPAETKILWISDGLGAMEACGSVSGGWMADGNENEHNTRPSRSTIHLTQLLVFSSFPKGRAHSD